MAKCNYCGTTILFGGTKDGDAKYCNDNCLAQGQLSAISAHIPPDVLKKAVQETHAGSCPRCNGQGPVDVHVSHRVWSAVFLTSWNSRPQICCRSCGIKSKVGDMAFSFFLGWWGFPWGLVATPIQIGRNFFGLFTTPDPQTPSPQLVQFVEMNLAATAQQHVATSSPPTLPPSQA